MPIEALVQNSGRRNDDGGVGSVDDHFCKSPRQQSPRQKEKVIKRKKREMCRSKFTAIERLMIKQSDVLLFINRRLDFWQSVG